MDNYLDNNGLFEDKTAVKLFNIIIDNMDLPYISCGMLKDVSVSEYLFLKSIVCFLIAFSDEKLKKTLKFDNLFLYLLFDFISFTFLPGVNCLKIESLMFSNKQIKEYLSDSICNVSPNLVGKYNEYLDSNCWSREKEIIFAASKYTIYSLSNKKSTTNYYLNQLYKYKNLLCIIDLIFKQSAYEFFSLCSVLITIKRWSNKKVLNSISIASHSMFVLFISFIISSQTNKSINYTNLFGYSLFHDLSETSTGDIVSPVKNHLLKYIGNDSDLNRIFDDVDIRGEKYFKLYNEYIYTLKNNDGNNTISRLVKLADILCAYFEGEFLLFNLDSTRESIFDNIDETINKIFSLSEDFEVTNLVNQFINKKY